MEEKLKPNKAYKKVRLFCDKVIAVVIGVLFLELDEDVGEVRERKTGLSVDQRSHHRY